MLFPGFSRFLQKMVARAGIDKAGNPPQSRSAATATRNEVRIPFFANAKITKLKEKILTGKYICLSQDLLFRGFSRFLQKNGSPGGDRTHDQLLRRQLLYPLSYRAKRNVFYIICTHLMKKSSLKIAFTQMICYI